MTNFIPPLSGDGSPFATGGPISAHSQTIKQWTRDCLRLDEDAIVTVSELACTDPGCPLIETVIVFDHHGSRKWKIAQPRAAVTRALVQEAITKASISRLPHSHS